MRSSEDISKGFNKAIDKVINSAEHGLGAHEVGIAYLSICASTTAEIAMQLADAQVPLRDQFAMAAMQAFITGDHSGATFWDRKDNVAAESYLWADAMLKAREEKQ